MPHRLDKLREAILELENELAVLQQDGDEELDAETIAALQHARADIEKTLSKEPDPNKWRPESFIDQLTEAEQGFAVSHPTIAGVVRRMIDALGQMGI